MTAKIIMFPVARVKPSMEQRLSDLNREIDDLRAARSTIGDGTSIYYDDKPFVHTMTDCGNPEEAADLGTLLLDYTMDEISAMIREALADGIAIVNEDKVLVCDTHLHLVDTSGAKEKP
jgi:hypothetical protein